MTNQDDKFKTSKQDKRFLKMSRRLIVDVLLNVMTYLLVYNILFIFQVRNSLINANRILFNLVLIILELILLIPFILVRLIYYITETTNSTKQMDPKFNSRGIIRTFTLHSIFWKYDSNLRYHLEMHSFSKRGGIHIFLELNDEYNQRLLEQQLQDQSIEEIRLEEISDDDHETIQISHLLDTSESPKVKGFHFKKASNSKGFNELSEKLQNYKIQFNNPFAKVKQETPNQPDQIAE